LHNIFRCGDAGFPARKVQYYVCDWTVKLVMNII